MCTSITAEGGSTEGGVANERCCDQETEGGAENGRYSKGGQGKLGEWQCRDISMGSISMGEMGVALLSIVK
jgi:hypothetical protein